MILVKAKNNGLNLHKNLCMMSVFLRKNTKGRIPGLLYPRVRVKVSGKQGRWCQGRKAARAPARPHWTAAIQSSKILNRRARRVSRDTMWVLPRASGQATQGTNVETTSPGACFSQDSQAAVSLKNSSIFPSYTFTKGLKINQSATNALTIPVSCSLEEKARPYPPVRPGSTNSPPVVLTAPGPQHSRLPDHLGTGPEPIPFLQFSNWTSPTTLSSSETSANSPRTLSLFCFLSEMT